ncbi:protein of unknown function [Methylocaldum szegediense]|uniref:Uncharacterized protein n=1 Tax=Methylocaldum szegediense TaxID=73780 RepID=A0ABM9I542_9GAMM|nr:protein of unknown function [Methylocaldum szegediense]
MAVTLKERVAIESLCRQGVDPGSVEWRVMSRVEGLLAHFQCSAIISGNVMAELERDGRQTQIFAYRDQRERVDNARFSRYNRTDYS